MCNAAGQLTDSFHLLRLPKRLLGLAPLGHLDRFWHYGRRAMAERTSITFENYNAPLHRWFDVRAYPARDGGLSLEARVQKRYPSNDILAEPFRAVLLGETINNCWICARIDRSTQQNDGRGHIGIAYFLHK